MIRDGQIVEVGHELRTTGEVINAEGCVVTPGLVNTHHHLYQTLTRAVPGGQDALLFGWLQTLYPIWSHFTPDHMFTSAQVGLAELALSGCTLSSDQLYLYPNGSRLEDTIHAAAELGIRFQPTRGAMSIGESDGGLPPDRLVEQEGAILEDCIRVIDGFHDASAASMCRVGVAPCSPFSVSMELMRDAAILARDKGVMMHTHLAENDEDIAYSLEKFGKRPGQYVEDLGWTGPDVWHAHCVKLDAEEIAMFARTKTGCCALPVFQLSFWAVASRRCAGCMMRVFLLVLVLMDQPAMMLAIWLLRARQAMLLQRVALGADAMSARTALEIATRGGADVLGRPECGRLAVGCRGDVAIWDTTGIESAGSWDPAALLLAGPTKVRHLIVEGRQIVREGQVTTIDLNAVIRRQNKLAHALKDQL